MFINILNSEYLALAAPYKYNKYSLLYNKDLILNLVKILIK